MDKMKILVLLIFSNWICNFSYGQNLLLNPDFEDYSSCPEDYKPMDKEFSEIIPFWTCPTFGTPDYFNKCAKSKVSIPDNFAGSSFPVSGNGYLGMILCGTKKDYREYAQGKLLIPLVKGNDYLIRINYRLASLSMYSVNQLGVYLSSKSLSFKTESEPKLTPQVKFDLKTSKEWVQQTGLYHAMGGEEFVIIGNFNDSVNNVLTSVNANITNERGKEYAYYYFDDLSIEAVPKIVVSHLNSDSVGYELVEPNNAVYKLRKSEGCGFSLQGDSLVYQFFLPDMQPEYSLGESNILKLKCKDLSNCIQCNSPSKSTNVPVLNLIFEDQENEVQLYNALKKYKCQ